MNIMIPLLAALGLFAFGSLGPTLGMEWIFGIALPYMAALLFVAGMVYRVLGWANVPVPFRIPTTCGQQKSLSWIQSSRLDNPSGTGGVIGRVLLEVLFFRSLLRNTKSGLVDGKRLVHSSDLTLWLGALAMHWSLLFILIRHLRLVVQPVPAFVTAVERVDGFFEIGLPVVFATSVFFLVALSYLLIRRLFNPQVRYLSLAADCFPLFLLLGIGLSGFVLRHVIKTDVAGVKELAVGLVTFNPMIPDAISPLFYGHLFLVTVLLIYFPFSKLVHMPGVFLSPTRNLANNNRRVRHVNPWDYPVDVHTYEEYEDDFREKMVGAGVPVERE